MLFNMCHSHQDQATFSGRDYIGKEGMAMMTTPHPKGIIRYEEDKILVITITQALESL